MQILFPLLIVISLPLYGIKIPLGLHGSLPLLDICLVFFSLVIMTWIYQKNLWRSFSQFLTHKNRLLPLTGLFVSAFGISWLHSLPTDDWQSGLGLIKSYLVLPSIFALCFSFLASCRPVIWITFWWWYAGYTTLLSFSALFARLLHQVTFDGRVALWFESPNHLAMAIAPGCLVWIFLLIKQPVSGHQEQLPRKISHPMMLLGLISLHGAAIFLTHSLGSLLAVGCILGTFLITKQFLPRPFPGFVFALSVGSLFLILLLPLVLRLAGYHPSIPATSIDSRLAIYQATQRMIQNNWLFGVGPGQFQSAYLSLQPYFVPYPQWAVPHAHNLLLHLWSEGGILALITMLMLINLAITHPQKNNTPADMLSLAIICYFLLHGLVDMPIWKNDQAVLWWLLLWRPLQNDPIQVSGHSISKK